VEGVAGNVGGGARRVEREVKGVEGGAMAVEGGAVGWLRLQAERLKKRKMMMGSLFFMAYTPPDEESRAGFHSRLLRAGKKPALRC
jgi:hypothetical protein